jgi:hypothetical protein
MTDLDPAAIMAEYVTQQAKAYVEAQGPNYHGQLNPERLYDAMEVLGPKLHAKFVKRVETLRALDCSEN